MKTLLLACLAVPLTSAVVFTQEGAAPRGQRVTASAFRSSGLTRLDGELWAAGPDYKARFDGGSVEFTPALGRAVEHNQTLALAVDALLRGTEAVHAAPAAVEPSGDGWTARAERWPGIEELWEAKPEGLALSYVFTSEPEGSGDLAVRLAVETSLTLRSEDGGLYYSHTRADGVEVGGVTIGGVTGIDARGHSVAGSLRTAPGAIELVLPEAFVESAAYPIVLDPLVGTKIAIESGTSNDDDEVDIASNGGGYVVVWERTFSTSDIDVRAQRMLNTGALDGGLIAVTTAAGVSTFPSAGYVRSSNAYCIAYQYSDGTLFADTDIKGRGMVANTGILGSEVTIAAATAYETVPRVSGDSTTTDDDAIVVWNELTTGIKACQVTTSSTGVLSPLSAVLIGGTSADDTQATVSKSGGPPARHLMAWKHGGASPQIRASLYDRNLNALTPVGFFVGSGSTFGDPAVDGDGRYWLVVYEDQEPTGTDFNVQTNLLMHYPDLGVLLSQGTQAIETDSNDNEINPAVAFTGNAYTVAWEDETTASEYDIGFKTVDRFTLATVENEAIIDTGTTDERRPAITSEYSGDGLSTSNDDDLLIAFSELESSGTAIGEIAGWLYEPNAGESVNLGGGCGFEGTIAVGSAGLGNSGFTVRLDDGLNGFDSFLLLGVEQVAIPCGTCTLGLDPFASYIVPTVADGLGIAEVQFGIPQDSALSGIDFFAQWSTTTIVGAQCQMFFTDFSDLLRVVIE